MAVTTVTTTLQMGKMKAQRGWLWWLVDLDRGSMNCQIYALSLLLGRALPFLTPGYTCYKVSAFQVLGISSLSLHHLLPPRWPPRRAGEWRGALASREQKAGSLVRPRATRGRVRQGRSRLEAS